MPFFQFLKYQPKYPSVMVLFSLNGGKKSQSTSHHEEKTVSQLLHMTEHLLYTNVPLWSAPRSQNLSLNNAHRDDKRLSKLNCSHNLHHKQQVQNIAIMKKYGEESTENENRSVNLFVCIFPSKHFHASGVAKNRRMGDPASFLEAVSGKGSYTNILHQELTFCIRMPHI